jgi:hypothetical protein
MAPKQYARSLKDVHKMPKPATAARASNEAFAAK